MSSPDIASLGFHEMPLVEASEANLRGLGRLFDDPARQEIEIVTWPAKGWRPVDPGTGNEGGTTEGIFSFWWESGTLHGLNKAVGDAYVLGWRDPPNLVAEGESGGRDRLFIRHANYHPDGGQLFFPMNGTPFIAPLAPPGDDVRPESFVAFYCDGTKGLYIHPGVWHEAIIPLADRADFLDRQGRVHARISCRFDREFGLYLAVPLVDTTMKGRHDVG